MSEADRSENMLATLMTQIAGQRSQVRQHADRLDNIEAGLTPIIQEWAGVIVGLQKLIDDAAEVADRNKIVDWLRIDDADQAANLIAGLTPWVAHVVVPYGAPFTRCWLWHPPVVQHLVNLQAMHREALKAKTQALMNSYLVTYQPAAFAAMEKLVGGCTLHEHKEADRMWSYDLSQDQEYARWWSRNWRNWPDLTVREPIGLAPVEDQE